jgi:hypothetical protein
MREPAEQTCPALKKMPAADCRAASFRSASANTMFGDLPLRGPSRDWGSSRHSRFGAGIGFEELTEGGTEFAVEAGTTDLEQEIGAAAGPSHLLGFVHAAVDQEVGRCFGQRGADPQTGTMAFGIVDQPSAPAGEITVMDAAPTVSLRNRMMSKALTNRMFFTVWSFFLPL